ncbi:MAG: ATP-binding protein [Acidobacteriota bacterium]
MNGDIPLARLEFFRKEIGLDETKLTAIRPYAGKLSARARKAGVYLDALFRKVAPRTRMELTLEYFSGTLSDFWFRWYSELWTRPWDDVFLSDLWRQGVYSARIGIELQYMMLGEVKCRQLFLRAVREDVPLDERGPVASAVNDLLDLCLMVRVKGHASYNSQCAEPLLQGLFHQTRNPLTIIGGTAMRLMRAGGPEISGMAQVILDEALRLERLTRDISTYNSLEVAEPSIQEVVIGPFLDQVLDGLTSGPDWPEGMRASLSLDPEHAVVEADPDLLREIFKEVLVNALQAMPATERSLSVSSRVDQVTPSHLSIAILGSGELPRGGDVDELFLPFHSTKPQGTGFGLAIARAAARKCFGRVTLEQTPDGVVCTVKLPLKGQLEGMDLLTQQDF